MRLIDADEFIKELKSLSIVLSGKQIFSDDAKDTVLRIINEQPTAYSVDKVVEELEDLKNRYDKNDFAIRGIIEKAIKIVKQSSVVDNVCNTKQGKWIFDKFTAQYGNPYRCSCCSEEFEDTYNYCPNCGVNMKEVE